MTPDDIVWDWPALSPEQRERLVVLMRGGGECSRRSQERLVPAYDGDEQVRSKALPLTDPQKRRLSDLLGGGGR